MMLREKFQALRKSLKPKRNKYGAKKTTIDGIIFHSKLEASYYEFLKRQQQSGTILFFLRQVPITLPGPSKYIADFFIFFADGSVNFVDVKGKDTPISALKRKQVEDLYPFAIELITKI